MSEQKEKRGLLYFSTLSYPTFGRGAYSEDNPPTTVTNSPYYWWFKFLQLNEDYKKTSQSKGKGKCSELYKDFGDVYKVNFKEWWRDKAYLFAEPRKNYTMHIANNADELAPYNSEEVVNLVVPLNFSQRSLKKYFTQLILKRVPKGKKGINIDASSAKYKISGRWRIDALEMAYKVYVERKANIEGDEFDSKKSKTKENIKMKRYKLTWADIAKKVGLNITNTKAMQYADEAERRRNATIVVKRHYSRAEAYIKSSITKGFPH
jgi:hypothetical protein